MINFFDQFIMLLSTDWFKPHWGVIGINLDEAAKDIVHGGCRKIVNQIISDAEEYWLISFSEDRHNETRALFESLDHF
ncbi:MAG TPA: hypothetical protein VFK06_15320 [Candidatus Angelobacter sp.]|nr:hypothetical protein [Candidatus Angelobacter sp.]